jgi:hypothetical protein
MIPGMAPADHHSEYLARTVAALTPEGHARVDGLLAQLADAGANRAWLVRFAKARRDEADLGRIDVTDVEPALMLSPPELDVLTAGFTTIRDTEQLDDVANWANAVLALLRDIEERLTAR